GIGPAEAERLLGGDHVDIGCVKVVNLEPDGVLELGLGDTFRLLGRDGPGPTLTAHIDWVGNIQIILSWSPGPVPAVTPVGDELRVGVKGGVGTQARREDIGPG